MKYLLRLDPGENIPDIIERGDTLTKKEIELLVGGELTSLPTWNPAWILLLNRGSNNVFMRYYNGMATDILRDNETREAYGTAILADISSGKIRGFEKEEAERIYKMLAAE